MVKIDSGTRLSCKVPLDARIIGGHPIDRTGNLKDFRVRCRIEKDIPLHCPPRTHLLLRILTTYSCVQIDSSAFLRKQFRFFHTRYSNVQGRTASKYRYWLM